MKEHSFNTATITTIGMFTAVLAVLSILQIPMPSGVPITLQTFAVALCGYVLGRKNGTLCVLLYLLLGFAGVPVFTGMTAGIGKLVGYTGGFLYGFLFLAFLLGAFHYSIIAQITFPAAFLLVSVPYLVKDILSVLGAMLVAVVIRKTLARGGINIQ